MIDHVSHIASVVKDELARQCAANGIGKDEAGYMAEFTFAPVINDQGAMVTLAPAIFVVVSLRSLLIGQRAKEGGLPAYGVVPPDEALRAVVARLVAELDAQRRDELRANDTPAKALA